MDTVIELSEAEKAKIKQNEQEELLFRKNLHSLINGDKKLASRPLVIGKTTNILAVCGADENLPLTITKKVIEKAMRPEMRDTNGNLIGKTGHNLSEKQLLDSLSELKKPAMVLKSKNNSIVVVTTLIDDKNRNIIIPIDLSVKEGRIAVNSIRSSYGRDNFSLYIEKNHNDGNILAINKEKANEIFQSIGKWYPKEEIFISFDNSIAYSIANVKYPEENFFNKKGDERSMTEQQMLEQIEALRREFEAKFAGMEEKFNNLSEEVQTINKFVAAMTEAQGFEQTMSEIESVTKQLTGCENAVFYCYDSAADKFFSGGGDFRNYEQTADNIRAAYNSGDIADNGYTAVIPLVSAKGETLGVIAAEKEQGFTPVDYDYFKSGSQIVSTVELALNKEFEHQGRVTDELTGLKNRQGLNEYVADTVRRNINADKPVNIVMCDIDHFKSINDTYGHDAGDVVLKNVARILQDGTRSGSDCAFRMGGEEMVLMLNCEPEQAYEIAERLRSEVENAVHTVTQDGQKKEISVTISMGVHQMKPEIHMTSENARAVFDSEFKNADELVYEAKESGRNKVVTDNSEAVIELGSYISDDEIKENIASTVQTAQEKENYSIFIMNDGGEEAYFRDDSTADIDTLLKRFADCNGKYSEFLEGCTKISGEKFAELDQTTKLPPAFSAEFDLVDHTVSVWDNEKISHADFDTVIEKIREKGTADLKFEPFAQDKDEYEQIAEDNYLGAVEILDELYDDFMYSSSIFNAEHIAFIDEHGELPDRIDTTEDRKTVSEYINMQLDHGSNLADNMRDTLTELKEQITEVDKAETALNITEDDIKFISEVKDMKDWISKAEEVTQERMAEHESPSKDNNR